MLLQCGKEHLAYAKTAGTGPGVVYLHGLMSTMDATKALFLEQHCINQGRAFIRFDYAGHGKSSSDFKDCNIGIWLNNVLVVLDELTTGPQILVGSSLGGWLMCLAALQRSKRIAGLLAIAASIDFTEQSMWQNFSSEIKHELETTGIYYMPSNYGAPYPITMQLITEARNHLLMHNENKNGKNNKINITCPVALVHGTGDTVVPWQHSMQIAESLTSTDVRITINKGTDHSFSNTKDLEVLGLELDRLINQQGSLSI
ncbi:MAG: alpha/beta hydrolase [Legionellales bacterium]|nr:MAG: alpha/beta hydrolase [Legionellales bacterium]